MANDGMANAELEPRVTMAESVGSAGKPEAANAAVAGDDERVDFRHKGMPPALWGRTVAEVREAGERLSGFPTPLLTLSRRELDHNRDAMARWCAERGIDLCPHGKASMAPQLWAEQLRAGAWGITVANRFQLGVARAAGVSTVMVANCVLSPVQLHWIADELAADPDFRVLVWTDSREGVALMEEALAEESEAESEAATSRPLDV